MPKQNESWKNPTSNDLFKTVLKLKTLPEAQAFFRDLLTLKEIKEFSNRWKAAQMLNDKVIYKEIEKETGMSPNTLARINKFIKGEHGGYRKMLKRK